MFWDAVLLSQSPHYSLCTKGVHLSQSMHARLRKCNNTELFVTNDARSPRKLFVYTQFAKHTFAVFFYLSRCIKAADKIVTLGSTNIYVQHRTQQIIKPASFQDTWKKTQAHTSFAKWLTNICKLANSSLATHTSCYILFRYAYYLFHKQVPRMFILGNISLIKKKNSLWWSWRP